MSPSDGSTRAELASAVVLARSYEALPPCEHCGGKLSVVGLVPATGDMHGPTAGFEPCPCAATDFIGKMDPAEFIDRLLRVWTFLYDPQCDWDAFNNAMVHALRQAGQQ